MSIAEILPAVRALPRSEKFRLARLLLDDLAGEELLSTIEQGQEFPIHTPAYTPGVAAQLVTLLDEQGEQPCGCSSNSPPATGTPLSPGST
jgi:hypothetical protein